MPDAQPNYLTTDAQGNVGANFSGHVSAAGVDFVASGSFGIPENADRAQSVSWYKDSLTGAQVARITGYSDAKLRLKTTYPGDPTAISQLSLESGYPRGSQYNQAQFNIDNIFASILRGDNTSDWIRPSDIKVYGVWSTGPSGWVGPFAGAVGPMWMYTYSGSLQMFNNILPTTDVYALTYANTFWGSQVQQWSEAQWGIYIYPDSASVSQSPPAQNITNQIGLWGATTTLPQLQTMNHQATQVGTGASCFHMYALNKGTSYSVGITLNSVAGPGNNMIYYSDPQFCRCFTITIPRKQPFT